MRCMLISAILFAGSTSAFSAEICGNGTDDDADGFADEGCYPGLTTGITDSPLSTRDTGMVSPSTGSLYYQLPADVSARVPFGPPIAFRRFYTSMYAPPGGSAWKTPLGNRWQHNFMSWLDDTGTTLVVHLPTGQEITAVYTTTSSGCDHFATRGGRATQYLDRCGGTAYYLRTLEGATLKFDITTKKLTEIRDSLATPNIVSIAYDGAGQVSTVTDASGHKRLSLAYSSGLLSSVSLQVLIVGGSWTSQTTTGYTYTSGNLTSVTNAGTTLQTNTYSGGYLTQIVDGGSKLIAGFSYNTVTAGKVVKVDTPRGTVGFEFSSTRASCSGKSILYFNKGNTTSCDKDADCGSGFLCGGRTGAVLTGSCFRAARCMTLDTTAGHHEDVVTAVSPLGPPSQTCDGACTEVATYLWSNGTNYVSSLGTQDPAGNYSARAVNSNGLPTRITYGDPDSNAANSNGAREVYIYYDSTFPGRVSEVRRKSELDVSASSCSSTVATGCARTRRVYNSDGLLYQQIEEGTTLDSSGSPSPYTYTTTYSYDTKGRLTQIDGPLAGSSDVTVFEYWTSGSDYLKDGYLQNYKQKVDSTAYLTTSALAYDFWGNPVTLRGANTDASHASGTVTCLVFDSSRGFLTQRREAMAGQSDCASVNGADLSTSWTRDTALRVTQLTRPDGSCVFNEYDSRGRLQRIKRRDDCNAGSAGDKQEFVYDEEGLVTEIQTYDASGTLTAKQPFTYFDSRRLLGIINPVDTSKKDAFVYDSRGFLSEVDGAGSLGKTVFHVDADGRTTSVDKYKDATLFDTWNLLYDWLGEQSSVTDGDGKATQTVRDDLGRAVELISTDMTYPTLRIYDAGSRLTEVIEAFGGGSGVQQTHTFTFDNIGRQLTADYEGACPTGTARAEIERIYDAFPAGSPHSCPVGVSCSRSGGRLLYVRTSLMCSSTYSATDGALDQETVYSYDDAGRAVGEYISDDSGRVAVQSYAWTKNRALASVTPPSGVALGWTYGSAGNNSDADLVTAQWRTNPATTTITDSVQWYPFGPLKQYNWKANFASGGTSHGMMTKIQRNVAYRVTSVGNGAFQDGTNAGHTVAITEDARGRVTARDFTPSDPTLASLYDSYFLYDDQDRLTCETSAYQTTCPTSGGASALKNNQVDLFTPAGDWKKVLRPIPGSTGISNQFNPAGYGASHQVTMIRQATGTPTLGDTTYGYDARGNRTYDDNTSTMTNDRRDYTYDARSNVINVRGRYYTGSAWHFYDVASSFDSKNRRVYKSFYDETTTKTSQWFFYYDVMDRVSEIRYTADVASPSTYSIYQLFWIGDETTLYWQVDYPSVTTSKRYVSFDELGRAYELWNWPASGNPAVYWGINESAWGLDTEISFGVPNIFQPTLFPGQYKDVETAALENDGTTVHRPGVVLNGFRSYDPFTGGYLQVDPLVPQTWSSYGYVNSNPVGHRDPTGLCSDERLDCMGDYGVILGDEKGWHEALCDIGDFLFGSACGPSGNATGWGGGTGYGYGTKAGTLNPPTTHPEDDYCAGGAARCVSDDDDAIGIDFGADEVAPVQADTETPDACTVCMEACNFTKVCRRIRACGPGATWESCHKGRIECWTRKIDKDKQKDLEIYNTCTAACLISSCGLHPVP